MLGKNAARAAPMLAFAAMRLCSAARMSGLCHPPHRCEVGSAAINLFLAGFRLIVPGPRTKIAELLAKDSEIDKSLESRAALRTINRSTVIYPTKSSAAQPPGILGMRAADRRVSHCRRCFRHRHHITTRSAWPLLTRNSRCRAGRSHSEARLAGGASTSLRALERTAAISSAVVDRVQGLRGCPEPTAR
jgi:hypothetical protein